MARYINPNQHDVLIERTINGKRNSTWVAPYALKGKPGQAHLNFEIEGTGLDHAIATRMLIPLNKEERPINKIPPIKVFNPPPENTPVVPQNPEPTQQAVAPTTSDVPAPTNTPPTENKTPDPIPVVSAPEVTAPVVAAPDAGKLRKKIFRATGQQ